jgi:hypothetical protein
MTSNSRINASNNLSMTTKDISHLIQSKVQAHVNQVNAGQQHDIDVFVNTRTPMYTPPLRFSITRMNENNVHTLMQGTIQPMIIQQSSSTSYTIAPNNISKSVQEAIHPIREYNDQKLDNNIDYNRLLKRQPSHTPLMQYVSVTTQKYIHAGNVYTSHGSYYKYQLSKKKIPKKIVKPVAKETSKIKVKSPPKVSSPHAISGRIYTAAPDNVRSMTFVQRIRQHEKVVKWLDSLGISLFEAVDLNTINTTSIAKDCMESIKNGIKLAEIVERLEGKVVPGIDKRPSKTAAIYNNVNRVLTLLRTRKNLNPKYLWSTREIMNGDEDVIWGLLEHIFEEYGKNYKVPVASNNRKRKLNTSNWMNKR